MKTRLNCQLRKMLLAALAASAVMMAQPVTQAITLTWGGGTTSLNAATYPYDYTSEALVIDITGDHAITLVGNTSPSAPAQAIRTVMSGAGDPNPSIYISSYDEGAYDLNINADSGIYGRVFTCQADFVMENFGDVIVSDITHNTRSAGSLLFRSYGETTKADAVNKNRLGNLESSVSTIFNNIANLTFDNNRQEDGPGGVMYNWQANNSADGDA